jgi:regulator of protease activity HflC (stomatin/prohibitin superfamily)
MQEENQIKEELVFEEKIITGRSGGLMLILTLVLMVVSFFVMLSAFRRGSLLFAIIFSRGGYFGVLARVFLGILSGLVCFIVCPILLCGLKIINPNEALVLVLFGKYYGTLKKEGFYWVNPFCSGVNPTAKSPFKQIAKTATTGQTQSAEESAASTSKKISLKTLTLSNDKQKVNDELGNPIEIGVNVIWKVTNTARAVFNVDHYKEYLSIQCDSAIRNIARTYPYDVSLQGDEKSLRGSSQEVAERLKEELQEKVNIAGIEILEARITHLAYSPEIAAAMLQRQQASAIIEARQMIVEGAVGMVEMALNTLKKNDVVNLDDERKAAMVSNLLVVLCGNREAQPIVNSGSLY